MSVGSRIDLIEVPVGGDGGLVWNRLHSEREDICEAMLKESRPGSEGSHGTELMLKPDDTTTANWHRELLQSRLLKIDSALDRLMSGSYGECSKCGRWIEDTKLDVDPAIAFCIDCWQQQLKQLNPPNSIDDSNSGVSLESVAPFDTILVRTLNSEYRIFLLDPKTGHAVVQGGRYFVEPAEAIVIGSVGVGSVPKTGWIGAGLRLQMTIDSGVVNTSPIQSVDIQNHPVVEPAFSTVH